MHHKFYAMVKIKFMTPSTLLRFLNKTCSFCFCCSLSCTGCLWSGSEWNWSESRWQCIHRTLYLGYQQKMPRQRCQVLAVYAVKPRRASVCSSWRDLGEIKPIVILLQSHVSSKNYYPWIQQRHGTNAFDWHEEGIFATRKLQLILCWLVCFGPGSM